MSKRPDRRASRTQTALREALMRLLRRKDYDEISVKDILAEADVGRSTFYAHCSGKDQLLRLSLRLLRAELAAAAQAIRETDLAAAPLAFSQPVLAHLADHRDLYPSLARGRGRDLLMSELRLLVLELAAADMASLPDAADMPKEAVLQFVVGAFVAVVAWWFERKGRLPAPTLDAAFRRLALGGLAGLGEA